MIWWMLMGCAGGTAEQDTGEPVDGFVRLHTGRDSTRPAFCAMRADGTAECFGFESVVQDFPKEQQFKSILPSEQCGLDLDGEILCWKEDWGLFGELPPGPYSKLVSGDYKYEYALAIREDTGTLEYAGSVSDPFQAVIDTEFARDVAPSFTSGEGCLLDLNGGVVCWPEDVAKDYWQPVPSGSFERVFNRSVDAQCALAADGRADCFGDYFQDLDWEFIEQAPPLREIRFPYIVTAENEVFAVDRLTEEMAAMVPDGELVVDIGLATHQCFIPLDQHDTVECTRMDEYPMGVLPPGYDE